MKNIAMLVIVALAFGFVLAGQAREPEPPDRYSLHLVRRGETLWEIAQIYMPDVDPRLGVQWIQEANGLQGSMIHPGDILNVPCENGPLFEPLGPEYSSEEAAIATERELQRLLGF